MIIITILIINLIFTLCNSHDEKLWCDVPSLLVIIGVSIAHAVLDLQYYSVVTQLFL